MGKIQNFDALATSPERKAALEITEAALAAIDTKAVIRKWVSNTNGNLTIGEHLIKKEEYDRLFVVGVGKCALEAGIALEEILGEQLSSGMLLTPIHPSALSNFPPEDKLKIFVGSHPFPTEANVNATSEIINLLATCTPKDMVLFVISGGGSTLLCQPRNLVCAQEKEILNILFDKGATIEEDNIIRKHLSLARGGHLAAYAYPARIISLIFSDVPGDDVQFIASGPTVMDTTTVAEAETIVKKYQLEKHLGFKIELLENPKDKKYFEGVTNIIVVSNRVATDAMEKKAEELGCKATTVTRTLQGEARKVGKNIAKKIHGMPPGSVLLYGGETTVTVKGSGIGGRNQEVALGAMGKIREGELILSFASDGRDNSDCAGALCDIMTGEKAKKLSLDPRSFLKRNDSFHFFEAVGDSLKTGDTGSNVSDLIIAMKL